MNTNRKYNVDQLLRNALSSNEKADPVLVQRVKNSYLRERTTTEKTRRFRSPLRVAIVIICLLVLTTSVVVATNFFGLSALFVPAKDILPDDAAFEIISDDGTIKEVPIKNVISLQGYVGSPEYEAFVEWSQFTASYDPDHAILMEVGNMPIGIDSVYAGVYGCYTQEMVDKLLEVADKYGLILHGNRTMFDPVVDPSAFDNFMNTVAEGNFVDIENSGFGGYIYEDGSFQFDFSWPVDESKIPTYEGDIWISAFMPEGREALNPELIDELWGENSATAENGKPLVWVPIDMDTYEFIVEDAFTMDYSSGKYVVVPYDGEYDLNEEWESMKAYERMTNEILFGSSGFQFGYRMKGTLDYVGISSTGIEDYSEWEYQTAHGYTVSLAQSDYVSLIVLDLDDAFVVVSFTGGNKFIPPSDLEGYADKFDFSKLK